MQCAVCSVQCAVCIVHCSSTGQLGAVQCRLEAVHSLWSRVQEGGVLVLVEAGTNAGFQVLT